MNESQVGAAARHRDSQEQKEIGLRAVAAAAPWPRKPEPDLRKADLATLMRESEAMANAMERKA